MNIEKTIRHRHLLFVPANVAGLITADQQNCCSPRIKRKEHSVRPGCVLNAKLFHVRMFRLLQCVSMRPAERRSEFLEKDNFGVHVLLLIAAKAVPPRLELVGKLNVPWHS